MIDAPRLLLVNGPNLNLLGVREPEKYGTSTLADVERITTEAAAAHGVRVRAVQSNHEGVLGGDPLDVGVRITAEAAAAHGVRVRAVQSNHEGVLIDAIHDARLDCVGIVINAGGFTHTSVALRDALTAVALPVAEVHITDIREREAFRHHSYIADVAVVHVIGEGVAGYGAAVDRLLAVVSGSADG